MLPAGFSDIDLLLDDSFRHYVFRTDATAVAWWEQYLQEHPEAAATIHAASTWYLQLYGSLKDHDRNTQLEQLKKAVEEDDRKIKPMWPAWLLRIAAVLLLVLGGHFIYQQLLRPAQTITPATAWTTWSSEWGQRRTLQLPDGSRLLLNNNTTIKIPDGYGKDNRHIIVVKGAVYVEVKEDSRHPFTVETKGVRTTVLGTRFIVKSFDYTAQASVALLSGKVNVRNISSGRELLLQPGQQAHWDTIHHRMKVAAVDTMALHTWKTGRLVFYNTPAAEVIEQLEDWYGVPFRITGKPRPEQRFSGAFDNDKLEKVLNVFCFTAGGTYQLQHGTVVITFK